MKGRAVPPAPEPRRVTRASEIIAAIEQQIAEAPGLYSIAFGHENHCPALLSTDLDECICAELELRFWRENPEAN